MAEITALLSYEDALRLAPETQAKYRAYRLRGEGEKGMAEVVEQLQKAVAAAFGLDERVGLEAMYVSLSPKKKRTYPHYGTVTRVS